MIKTTTTWTAPDGKEYSYAWGFPEDIDMRARRKEMMREMMKEKEDKNMLSVVNMTIKNVIFNDPATIVYWADGTKTVVKCYKNDAFDPEKGLAMAIVKKVYGNDTSFHSIFKKWSEKYEEEYRDVYDSVGESIINGIVNAMKNKGKRIYLDGKEV